MSHKPSPNPVPAESAVDDVRRVRERLSNEAGGNIQELVQASQRAFEENRERLGLKVVKAPDHSVRPEGTHG